MCTEMWRNVPKTHGKGVLTVDRLEEEGFVASPRSEFLSSIPMNNCGQVKSAAVYCGFQGRKDVQRWLEGHRLLHGERIRLQFTKRCSFVLNVCLFIPSNVRSFSMSVCFITK